MTLVDIAPLVAAAALIVFMLAATGNTGAPRKGVWLLPAFAAAGFAAWSLAAIVNEGPTGFWVEHTRNLWGVQIWFDLLLAVSIGWFLIVPRAKAVGMTPLPWLVLILCSGSIGFLVMTARFLYLSERKAA